MQECGATLKRDKSDSAEAGYEEAVGMDHGRRRRCDGWRLAEPAVFFWVPAFAGTTKSVLGAVPHRSREYTYKHEPHLVHDGQEETLDRK